MSEAAEEADDIVTRVPQVFQLLKRLVQGSSTVARDHGTCTTGVIHKSREFRSSRIRFDDAIAPACAPTVLPPGDSGAASVAASVAARVAPAATFAFWRVAV